MWISIKQSLRRRLCPETEETAERKLRRLEGTDAYWQAAGPVIEGDAGVASMGHRHYVGGMWDLLGLLQLGFLVDHGLRPHHVLADVACGSLRAGVRLIPYLDAGNYLGMDKTESLIRAGLEKELPAAVREEKRPEFVISDRFELDRFTKRPDFAIAQSLFTHLNERDIRSCLRSGRAAMTSGGRFFASFFEVGESIANPEASGAHPAFRYTRQEMEQLGASTGWTPNYVGDWGHPYVTSMMEFIA